MSRVFHRSFDELPVVCALTGKQISSTIGTSKKPHRKRGKGCVNIERTPGRGRPHSIQFGGTIRCIVINYQSHGEWQGGCFPPYCLPGAECIKQQDRA
jgi:hypothetical protein